MMVRQHNCGDFGEFMGECWLEKQGYTILHRNWRVGRLELDRVTCKDGTLHIIEIKTRTNIDYGMPETFITAKKLQHLRKATIGFLQACKYYGRYQIDVLAIHIRAIDVDFMLFEDVG